MKDYTKGYEPGGCFILVMAISVACFGLFAPVPAGLTFACGAASVVLLVLSFMKGMSG